MSEDADEGETAEESEASAPPDEPLGDIAARVRELTGERDPAERPRQPNREGPLADVASGVDERRRRKREEGDVFESVDVGELDGEKLWEQPAEGGADETGSSVPVEETPEVEWDDEAEWEDDGRDVRTIPKETCHGCRHLGEPPELACTHEGTDILAMPDADHFRVADCPMVVDEEEVSTFETTDGDAGRSGDDSGVDATVGDDDGPADAVTDPDLGNDSDLGDGGSTAGNADSSDDTGPDPDDVGDLEDFEGQSEVSDFDASNARDGGTSEDATE